MPRPTRVLVACDSLKGTLPSYKAGEAVECGIREAVDAVKADRHGPGRLRERAEVDSDHATGDPAALAPSLSFSSTAVEFYHCPMSDGGAGLLDSLTYATAPAPTACASIPTAVAAAAETLQAPAPAAPSAAASALPPAHSPLMASLPSVVGLKLRRVRVPAGVPVTGPLGKPIGCAAAAPAAGGESADRPVTFACDVARRVAVVEMAEASGLPRVPLPAQRDPRRTTSFGTGEVLRYAMQYMTEQLAIEQQAGGTPPSSACGVDVFVGIGGSATNDGGLGALQGLGVVELYVRDEASSAAGAQEELLRRPFRGGDLGRLSRVALTPEMRRLFSPLPASHPSSGSVPGGTGGASPAAPSGRPHVYIRRVRLICDVDNPLVGPRGATYTFGPQKCAPPPPAPCAGRGADGGPAEASHSEGPEDGAVGVVTSQHQQFILDELEKGMRHAAECAVASTFDAVQAHHSQVDALRAAGTADASSAAAVPAEALARQRAACLDTLLNGSGGGGAGGMSGFLRYFLGATWVSGTDAVAELLGLRHFVSRALPTAVSPSSLPLPTGLLYTHCDVLVTGEGSFDVQTIDSHKTVGRLLEMAVEANLTHLLAQLTSGAAAPAADAVPCGRVKEFIVLCGRSGFQDEQDCQKRVREALARTLVPTADPAHPVAGAAAPHHHHYCSLLVHAYAEATALAAATPASTTQPPHDAPRGHLPATEQEWTAAYVRAIIAATPRVTVLPLSPHVFSVSEAMRNPYECLRRRAHDYSLASLRANDRAGTCHY